MKPRDLLSMLGVRPRPRAYGYSVAAFTLPKDGTIQYARWLHPGETAKTLQQEAVDELRKYIAPGDVAIDIGAHTGDTAIPMALAAGRGGCVLALEPNPYVLTSRPTLRNISRRSRRASGSSKSMRKATTIRCSHRSGI